MFIVMHCMGMPFNGTNIKEKSLGGSESACYYIARELAALGHRVSVFTNHTEEGKWDGVNYGWLGEVTEQFPLGERFMHYAVNTPTDVLIMQRYPLAFKMMWNSKINLWWLHDLALLRNVHNVLQQLWNISGILTVSEWHKNQIVETWGLNPDIVMPITNGVDLSLYGNQAGLERVKLLPKEFIGDTDKENEISLLYAARPERGLVNLVGPGGIMEKLLEKNKKFHLYVCGYDNTVPEMVGLYNSLWGRIEELENCTNLGSLTKKELAAVQEHCDAYVYPTTFEDTSCIVAMECAAAGLPFIATKGAALPETCEGGGAELISLTGGGLDINLWVNRLIGIFSSEKEIKKLRNKQLHKAPSYTWSNAIDLLEKHIAACFAKNDSRHGAKLRHLIRMSDIYAAKRYLNTLCIKNPGIIIQRSSEELETLYKFAWNNTWKSHYDEYYQHEKDKGVEYGPEDLTNEHRFRRVAFHIAYVPVGGRVLDYGCAHGHYTINLARAFPDLKFVGIDIAQSNIDIAKKWASDEEITNVKFYVGEVRPGDYITNPPLENFDAIIVAEVLEHVESPQMIVDQLLVQCAKKDCTFILTTPYGPWEYQGFIKEHPWRAHVHHFDRPDLHDMFGKFDNFEVTIVPSGNIITGEALGSYVTTFKNSEKTVFIGDIDYERKFAGIVPLQTISFCMIVKNGEETLLRSLNQLKGVVQQIVIGVDSTTTDNTLNIIKRFSDEQPLWPTVEVFDIESPLIIGFDEARNKTLEKAVGDWILWVDHDEITVYAENIVKYLRDNQFAGYSIKQHHFAVDPLGVIKTDLPCRLFRNHEKIKFFGVVHEHPEKKINSGVGHAMVIEDVDIAHEGYTTDIIRHGRFNRNVDLMLRDREKYPDRKLGKFLWMRDISQMCAHELRFNGGKISPEMKARAEKGIEIWEELLENGELRMLSDGMTFYSLLASVLNKGFDCSFAIDIAPQPGVVNINRVEPITAKFASQDHLMRLLGKVIAERTKHYESKYF